MCDEQGTESAVDKQLLSGMVRKLGKFSSVCARVCLFGFVFGMFVYNCDGVCV